MTNTTAMPAAAMMVQVPKVNTECLELGPLGGCQDLESDGVPGATESCGLEQPTTLFITVNGNFDPREEPPSEQNHELAIGSRAHASGTCERQTDCRRW